jgi:hypothetical protein
MVPRRRIEDLHITRFLAAAGLSPEGGPQPSDRPDCLLRFDGALIGVEHTEFFFPVDPGQVPYQQLDALQGLTVEQARRLFRQRGGPPLYVYPVFDDRRGPRTKRDAYGLAERLAELVARNGWPRSLKSETFEVWRDLPGIHSYSVMPSVDGEDELWHGGSGGWVATVEAAHVQAALDRKAPLYPQYVQRAPAVWLLVVNDMCRGGTPCEIGPEARGAVYSTPFDRAFWLELVSGTATELRRRGARPVAS